MRSFISAGRPQSNGCVERVQLTILEECWKPAFARLLIPRYQSPRRDLERYLAYYNHDRAHTGRWTAAARLRKCWARRPVTRETAKDASLHPGGCTA